MYNVILITKNFTQKKCINYYETFSIFSKKDSFRIIIILVAHFDLEPYQTNVKTIFLNGDLGEEIYMTQPEDFSFKENNLVSNLESLFMD